MKYQIVLVDEDGTRFVLHLIDDPEKARQQVETIKKMSESKSYSFINSPLWRLIELYKVELVEVVQIEDDLL